MRLLSILICIPALLPAQTGIAQDAREIVRRAVELDKSNAELIRGYTYLQRTEQRQTDSSGKVKEVESNTFAVTLEDGSPYRRLIAHNDQPLSPREQKKEEEKRQSSVEARGKESREERQRRIAEWDRRLQQRREPIRELPDAFDFTVVREEALNGSQTYVIDATPKPGYRPKLASASYLPKVKVRLWIAKSDGQWVKMDLESLDTISLGGLVLRLAKGTHLTIEQERINNEAWLPKRLSIQGSARILLVKGFHGEINVTFSDYRKPEADAPIVSIGQSACSRTPGRRAVTSISLGQ